MDTAMLWGWQDSRALPLVVKARRASRACGSQARQVRTVDYKLADGRTWPRRKVCFSFPDSTHGMLWDSLAGAIKPPREACDVEHVLHESMCLEEVKVESITYWTNLWTVQT